MPKKDDQTYTFEASTGQTGEIKVALTSAGSKSIYVKSIAVTYTPAPTAVDLGLPSGTKWADMNVGAGSETGYGTYYAWSSSDIATAQWGNDWRMPTMAEIEELKSYTDQEWATIGGVNGMKFMKKTDHSVYIFLPATGLNSSSEVGTIGYYWTSTEESSPHAYFLYASSSSVITSYYRTKTDKLPVRPVQMFAGEGTEASPYLIASTTDWNNLVSAVNGGETYSGNYFKMTADVETWAFVGTNDHPFMGTLDGQGYSVNCHLERGENFAAPFAVTQNATFKDVIFTGYVNIVWGHSYLAGIVGYAKGTTRFSNCKVSSTLECKNDASMDVSGGGFVGSGQDLIFENCVFDGKLIGANAYNCGGFVGWCNNTATLTNCLFKPSEITFSSTGSYTFVRNGSLTLTNSYYTQAYGTAQGNQARTISAGDYVSTLAISGDATATYDVSGITVYSTGISFNDGSTTTFYGGSGQTVSLTLTPETRDGYQFKQYAASQGTLSDETTDTPTLTMPDANSTANDAVTISAEYDPLYNAAFADASDASNGWSISPTSGIVGSTVTVRYEGENKVKSVSVLPKGTVDLGLPSGTLWATMNVGATSETGFGTYFAWAGTAAQADYSQASTPYNNGSSYSKYNDTDNKTTLEAVDDAATVTLGSHWRMPTKEEMQELVSGTDQQWFDDYEDTGIKGTKFMKKTDHTVYIFLPAAGYKRDTSTNDVGVRGLYYSSSVGNTTSVAWRIVNNSSGATADGQWAGRNNGFTVRAVWVP